MYWVEESRRPNCIEIAFDYWERIPGMIDPFYALVMEYAAQNELTIKTVDFIYQYKFIDDEFDLRFLWFGTFTVYVNIPLKRDMPEVWNRLKKICASLNRRLYELKRNEKNN